MSSGWRRRTRSELPGLKGPKSCCVAGNVNRLRPQPRRQNRRHFFTPIARNSAGRLAVETGLCQNIRYCGHRLTFERVDRKMDSTAPTLFALLRSRMMKTTAGTRY